MINEKTSLRGSLNSEVDSLTLEKKDRDDHLTTNSGEVATLKAKLEQVAKSKSDLESSLSEETVLDRFW